MSEWWREQGIEIWGCCLLSHGPHWWRSRRPKRLCAAPPAMQRTPRASPAEELSDHLRAVFAKDEQHGHQGAAGDDPGGHREQNSRDCSGDFLSQP